MKKVLVTGSNGLLGQKLIYLFLGKEEYELYAISRGKNRLFEQNGYTYYNVDLTDIQHLVQTLELIQPDFIIHTAAMTHVDACESQQEACNILNVEVVRTLADFAKTTGSFIVHLSTDFIFDGEKGEAYTEEDKPNPLSYYGKSKLASETLLLDAGIDVAILRTILVYGLVDGNTRSNIVLWVKGALEKKERIRVVTDQWRMPTYAEDLADACLRVVERQAQGVFNVSSSELLSIYEIAHLVADAFGLDGSLIDKVSSDELNLPAKRPTSTGFDLSKSVESLDLPVVSFSQRLQVFKDQLNSLSS